MDLPELVCEKHRAISLKPPFFREDATRRRLLPRAPDRPQCRRKTTTPKTGPLVVSQPRRRFRRVHDPLTFTRKGVVEPRATARVRERWTTPRSCRHGVLPVPSYTYSVSPHRSGRYESSLIRFIHASRSSCPSPSIHASRGHREESTS